MSLLTKLKSSIFGFGGKTPSKFSDNPVRLHELGEVDLKTSQLDLDGKTPKKYLDNPPK